MATEVEQINDQWSQTKSSFFFLTKRSQSLVLDLQLRPENNKKTRSPGFFQVFNKALFRYPLGGRAHLAHNIAFQVIIIHFA